MNKNTKVRYFIAFSYNGKSFFGFQIQPNKPTIQEIIEKALSILLREDVKIIGAGRTDSGVHAIKMYAHFDTEKILDNQLVYKLNSFLPSSIVIHKIFRVKKYFHARFSALYRTYEYHISLKKNPFTENYAWQLWRKDLDIDSMNSACKILFQYKDFTSFAKLHTDNKTNFCQIKKASWEQSGDELKFTISSDRFLRNMVRAIVGTMVEVGTGKIDPEYLHHIFSEKNRNAAGISAPAHGLYLVDVVYNFDD